jgi:hypothetical protein
MRGGMPVRDVAAMTDSLFAFAFKHPFGKSFGLTLLSVLISVFSGAFIFDITRTDNKGQQFLDWRSTLHSDSFWALTTLLLVSALHAIALARYESYVKRAVTQATLQQRVLEELFEPIIDQVKGDLKSGKYVTVQETMRRLSLTKDR